MLYNDQKEISLDISDSLDKKELFNIPTGRGKTFILLDVSSNAVVETSKNVIVSTSNNALVRDMFATALEFNFMKEKEISIAIGNDNYIDRDKLIFYMNSGIIYEYIQNKEDELLDFLNTEEDLFFDIFEGIIKYKDVANVQIVKNLITRDSNEKTVFNDGVIITNHFYLISKIMYDKNFDISKYIILIDEVHEIGDVAQSVLNHSFSIYDFRNMFSSMKKDIENIIEFKGKKTIVSNMETIIKKASVLHKKYASECKVGLYEQGYESNKNCFDDIKTLLTSKEYMNITSKILKNTKSIVNFQQYETYIKKVNSYLLMFSNLHQNKNSCGVFYSPSKGYPSLTVNVSNPLGILNSKFWNKIEYFAGVSATVTSSFNPTTFEQNYGYQRIGLAQKGRKDYYIHYYNRIFPKELVDIFLPKKGIKKDSVYSDDFKAEESEYYNYIVDYINETHNNKNSIILCGGYLEAQFLYNLYKKKYGNHYPLDYAKKSKKTSTTLKEFQQTGGLLFATRNYNTGISLKGKLLENLYILKFPFVDYTAKKWQEVKLKSMGLYSVNYEREMLISLMQTLGRVQRSKDDKGSIHILDSRYHSFNADKKKKILDILNEYGVIQDIDANKLHVNDIENELEQLLCV